MVKRTGDFSKTVVRLLRDQVNGRCSNPRCRRATVGPSQEDHEKTVITGEAAHIRAASPNGPRFDTEQSETERSNIENGIWLCSACADLIDKNDGVDYPIEVLQEWKRSAKAEATKALDSPSLVSETPWHGRYSLLSYINVPRLAMWAAGVGLKCDLGIETETGKLHDLGWRLNKLLLSVGQVLNQLPIMAVDLERLGEVGQDFTGRTVSFDRQFYTKNGPDPADSGPASPLPSDWEKAPHLHSKVGRWKCAVVYDPKWVTTTTAHVEFRSGRRRFTGVGIVKEVDQRRNLVIISPLLIGLPKPASTFLG